MDVIKKRIPVNVWKLPVVIGSCLLFYALFGGKAFAFPALIAAINVNLGMNSIASECYPFAKKRFYSSLIGVFCGGLYLLCTQVWQIQGEVNLFLLLGVAFLAMLLCKKYTDKAPMIGAVVEIALIVLVKMDNTHVWCDFLIKVLAILVGNLAAYLGNLFFDHLGIVDKDGIQLVELTDAQKWKRIFKVLILMVLCFWVSLRFPEKEQPFILLISLLTAVIGMRPDTKETWHFGLYRTLGTAIGCGGGLVYLMMNEKGLVSVFTTVLVIPLLILLAGLISCLFVSQSVVLSGAVVAIVILALVVSPDGGITYSDHRLWATVIGALAALLTNLVVHLWEYLRTKKPA